MSAQHTPGPWFLPTENSGSSGTAVWARGGDVRVAKCDSGAISLPGRQCDARLIAAAPDLLEALIRGRELMLWAQSCSVNDEQFAEFQIDLNRCDAAIAKATGSAS